MPPGLDWPFVPEDGERKGLLFAGQIDLADLQGVAPRGLLPKQGVLYFFYSEDWALGRSDPEGHLRRRVLFHPGSARELEVRQPPLVRFSLTDFGAAPVWLDPKDPRRSGGFRFDLQFRTFDSYPDGLDDIDFGADDDEIDDVEETHSRIQAASLRRALKGVQPALNVPSKLDTRPAAGDWIITWSIIAAFAKVIILPPAGPHSPLEEFEPDNVLRKEAATWLERSLQEAPLATPAPETQLEFFDWIRSLQPQGVRFSQQMGWKLYPAWKDAARHAVNELAEIGELDRVPATMMAWLNPSLGLTDQYIDIYVQRHQMFGHGSSDHAVVSPSEKKNRVLLLKISGGDHPGFGANGGEGAHHYWIERDKLKKLDFSAVELTC